MSVATVVLMPNWRKWPKRQRSMRPMHRQGRPPRQRLRNRFKFQRRHQSPHLSHPCPPERCRLVPPQVQFPPSPQVGRRNPFRSGCLHRVPECRPACCRPVFGHRLPCHRGSLRDQDYRPVQCPFAPDRLPPVHLDHPELRFRRVSCRQGCHRVREFRLSPVAPQAVHRHIRWLPRESSPRTYRVRVLQACRRVGDRPVHRCLVSRRVLVFRPDRGGSCLRVSVHRVPFPQEVLVHLDLRASNSPDQCHHRHRRHPRAKSAWTILILREMRARVRLDLIRAFLLLRRFCSGIRLSSVVSKNLETIRSGVRILPNSAT